MNNLTLKLYFQNIYEITNCKVKLYLIRKCYDMNDVNDIFQDTYMEFYKVLVKKGINYVENPEAFLVNIAKKKVHKFYGFFYKRPPQVSLSDEEMIESDNIFNGDMDIDEQIINKELVSDIKKRLMKKSGDIQKIFYLYYSLDYSLADIAITLQMNESTVKTKLYRTLKEFRNYYREAEEYERA